MSKLRFAKLVAILYLLAIATLGFIVPGEAGAAVCHEDEPCWVWSKVGNHKRGVIVAGKLRVVGPCQFAKLGHAKRIDSATPRLRGDVWAHWICD
jgi:hypothetical protein